MHFVNILNHLWNLYHQVLKITILFNYDDDYEAMLMTTTTTMTKTTTTMMSVAVDNDHNNAEDGD